MATRTPLSIELSSEPALTVSQELVKASQVSYLMVADKHLKYPKGSSRVAYIGTTYTGFWRLTSSTAERANRILRQRDVTSFVVLPVHAQPRSGLRTWELLEKSLLSIFRERYGCLPRCNKRGGTLSKHFDRDELLSVIEQFE